MGPQNARSEYVSPSAEPHLVPRLEENETTLVMSVSSGSMRQVRCTGTNGRRLAGDCADMNASTTLPADYVPIIPVHSTCLSSSYVSPWNIADRFETGPHGTLANQVASFGVMQPNQLVTDPRPASPGADVIPLGRAGSTAQASLHQTWVAYACTKYTLGEECRR